MKASSQLIRRAAQMEELNLDEPAHVNGFKRPKSEAIPITQFDYPEEDDPNCLIGNDGYLSRGGGMLLVSYAGVGKSSFIMDACMMWALGRPWLGIRCVKPLKSLIIQAEDSQRYIGKVRQSFTYANDLSPAEIQQIGQNCQVVRLKGVAGPSFFEELKELTEFHRPDLVIINPVYIYANGDIGKSEFAQPFINNLDFVNRLEKFAYILVHHTGKPAARQNGKREDSDDWESVYMGFGSSYFANWPRVSALIEPVGNSGQFVFKLGKGRHDAGITKEVPSGAGVRLETVTRVTMRHSTKTMPVGKKTKPLVYWELDDATQSGSAAPQTNGAGRRRSIELSDIILAFPVGREKATGHRAILKYAKEIKPSIGNSTLERIIDDGIELGVVFKDASNPRQPKYYLEVGPEPR